MKEIIDYLRRYYHHYKTPEKAIQYICTTPYEEISLCSARTLYNYIKNSAIRHGRTFKEEAEYILKEYRQIYPTNKLTDTHPKTLTLHIPYQLYAHIERQAKRNRLPVTQEVMSTIAEYYGYEKYSYRRNK